MANVGPAPVAAFAPVAAEDAAALEQERDVQERDDVLVLGGRGKAIRTIGEAVEHLHELMDAQVTKALDLGAPANAACPGDAAARNTFYTLLPDVQQRLVFVRLAGQMRAWPRLRPLFGAPPYGFLRPEDAGLLRAAGIAQGRANMTHDAVQAAASYTQFGAGQLTDELAREYRVIRQAERARRPTRCRATSACATRRTCCCRCGMRRRNRAAKMELMRDATQRERLLCSRGRASGSRSRRRERILSLQGLRAVHAATRTHAA